MSEKILLAVVDDEPGIARVLPQLIMGVRKDIFAVGFTRVTLAVESKWRPFTHAVIDMGIGSYGDQLFYEQLARILLGDGTKVFAMTGQMSQEAARLNGSLGIHMIYKPASSRKVLQEMGLVVE